jgi:hypothetical protein
LAGIPGSPDFIQNSGNISHLVGHGDADFASSASNWHAEINLRCFDAI